MGVGVSVNRAPEKFFIRRGDRLPYFTLDVYDSDGDPVDLSAASSTVFTMLAADGTTKKIDREAATIVNGPDGATQNRLQYAWAAGDTDDVDRYLAEFELTFAGGKRTIPPSRDIKLEIEVTGDLDET